MSDTTRLGYLAANAQAEALSKLLDGGFLDVMEGEQPDGPDIVISDDLRLARCRFAGVAFGKPINGVIRANAIEKAIATKTGVPSWVRCSTSDGIPVLDGSYGKSNANVTSKVAMIVEGQIVSFTEFRHVVNKSADGRR